MRAGYLVLERCPTRANGDQCGRTRGHDGWHGIATPSYAISWAPIPNDTKGDPFDLIGIALLDAAHSGWTKRG